MIDYVKLLILNIDIGRLLKLEGLDFKSEVSVTTGELSNTKVAEYLFCKIIVKKNNKFENVDGMFVNPHILFAGSIHKMWNELQGIKAPNYKEVKIYKGFNGNQFNINNIFEVRKHLENLFGCDSGHMIFQNVELGVNTTPLFNPKLFLKGLLYHKNISFEYSHSGNYAQAIHNYFIFKIYNKSHQYKMQFPVLRIELKITKMEELKGYGIVSFADISMETLNKAKLLISKRFEEVMHYDYTIKKNGLSKKNLQKLQEYSNPRYWIEDLKPIHRDRHKKILKKITLRYSDNIFLEIEKNIIEKCVMINQPTPEGNCVMFNHSGIGVTITPLSQQKITYSITN